MAGFALAAFVGAAAGSLGGPWRASAPVGCARVRPGWVASAHAPAAVRTRRLCGAPRARGARGTTRMLSALEDDGEQIKRFVLQRALQTVMFYMRTCRDTPTADWLERFLELPGLNEYHGLDGLREPWRMTVTRLFAEPPTSIVVQSIPRNRAGSGNNPYLPPKVLTMAFDIVPQRIALRVLDCTLEVAQECADDLGLMSQENDQIRRAYVAGSGSASIRASTYPTLAHEPEGTSKSAFRGGTYDLLKRLVTREAARGAIKALEPGPGAQWLARFYKANGAAFDGESRYHVGDDFLKALLAEMPAVSSGGVVDPKAIADGILDQREAVAERLREQLASVPGDVQDIKRDFLEKGFR
ncbi:hypothetical protein KFE25_006915 [Diacronema lutheri]|uniref:Uncharacterized protein n=2 Tax=Diacronema lutheri TaxID=2081491 RepID=A0A8J5XMQ3_DIALT|nr:hypothetical protein KFE25_006915 [Diacronema lutheri]